MGKIDLLTPLDGKRKTLSALDILDMDIPDADKIWAAVRASTEQQYVEFACQCAESVLPLFESRYPDDPRPRNCIETTRRYMAGDATRDELLETARAARAAWAARAAEAAAWAAETARAARAAWAAEAAARAARAAERQKQVQMLREILEGK